MKRRGLSCLCGLVAVQIVGALQEIPAGTRLHARLTSAVSSQSSRPGDPISAVLIAPVPVGTRALPAGTVLKGTVSEAVAHSLDHDATLRFTFDRLTLGDRVTPLATRLVEIDNARERVDSTGMILGPSTPADRPAGRVELLSLALVAPQIFLVDVAGSRLLEGVRAHVSYGSGVELDVEVTRPFSVSDGDLGSAIVPPVLPASLRTLLPQLPVRTSAGQPPLPADVINVVFIGPAPWLERAFLRAEWETADKVSLRADVKTFLAIASGEGYREGPVSLQFLDGRAPDYVFQKQNNTFAKRHHVRIWRHGSWEGRPVWVGAGTHDIGVKFAFEERSFTHRVDPRVDVEREKIVGDLAFAGIPPAAYADRPTVPRSMQNATQDGMVTDGRIAVMLLSDLK